MNGDYSDALVVFGITGDLAFKKIFPALENLERRGRLPEIVVGVARGGLTLAAYRRAMRAKASRATATASTRTRCDRLEAKFRYVDGDYRDDATFAAAAQGARRRSAGPATTWPSRRACSPGGGKARQLGLRRGCPRRRRKAAGPRPRRARSTINRALQQVFDETLDLPHRPLPRQGAGAEPALLPLRQRVHRADLEPHVHRAACRSPWPRSSASRDGAGSTRNSARCATSCRTTCCRCSRSLRWSRPSAPAPKRCATRR